MYNPSMISNASILFFSSKVFLLCSLVILMMSQITMIPVGVL